jgi:hypothetical protein
MSLSYRFMLRADSEHLSQLALVAETLGQTQSGAIRYLIRCAAQQLLSAVDAPDAERSSPTTLHLFPVSDAHAQLGAAIEHLVACYAEVCASCTMKAIVPTQSSVEPREDLNTKGEDGM